MSLKHASASAFVFGADASGNWGGRMFSLGRRCVPWFACFWAVHARSRELNFLTVVLRFYGSPLSLWHLDGKSRVLFSSDVKSEFTIVGFVQISRSWKDFAVRSVNSCWQWTRSKHHVCMPKPCGSCYLVNNSVRPHNHTMSVTLNLGAVGIIQPASKPAHILYLKLIFHEFARRALWLYSCLQANPSSTGFYSSCLIILPMLVIIW